jgi:uncharacterized membrane-anchored protein
MFNSVILARNDLGVKMIYKVAAISLLTLGVFSRTSFAEDAPAPLDPQVIWDAAMKVSTSGPADVSLSDQAIIHLPEGMAFFPKEQSNALMVAWGNAVDDRLLGMVVPRSDDENWVTTIDATFDGYVKDEEAKKWNAEELLQTLKDGTEAQNKDRAERGFPALDVVGWIEKPNYEATAHRLVWSVKMVHRGADADEPAVVNYNTYVLGRDGYLEVDLLTDEKTVEAQKPFAKQVLAAIQYNSGKRYEDFKAGSDHMAEYGIAALIGGAVAHKLGFLALASVFVLKFIKIIGLAVLVGLGGLKRFFTKKPKDDA